MSSRSLILRLILVAPALLSLPGCVAAIPLAAQLISGATSASQLCAATRMPGQQSSLCDRLMNNQPQTTTTAQNIPPAQNGKAKITVVR